MKISIPVVLLYVVGLTLVAYQFTFAKFSASAQNNNNTFAASAEFPTPTPPTISSGDVVINEISWGGSYGDGNDEWIELYNTTNFAINLNGWVVENLGTGSGPGGNITIATTSSTIIPAHDYYLIASKNKDGSKINVDPEFVKASLNLHNDGEQLILKTNSGVLIDTANRTTGAWFAGSDSTKSSMERTSTAASGTDSGNWHTCSASANMDPGSSECGTPKAQNSP